MPAEGPTLWTTNLSDCTAIATFDPEAESEQVARTLYHSRGGRVPDAWYTNLARMLDGEHTTYVIVANGDVSGDEASFESVHLTPLKENLIAAMENEGKETGNLVFKIFFSEAEDDDQKRLVRRSFAIDESGFWGRAAVGGDVPSKFDDGNKAADHHNDNDEEQGEAGDNDAEGGEEEEDDFGNDQTNESDDEKAGDAAVDARGEGDPAEEQYDSGDKEEDQPTEASEEKEDKEDVEEE
ncbi:hypothetical protein M7I_5256 [Glarea lozoyensis 74030]|uniref:Uncharacterized protein n=1 Tax=Glarea lozoyensis (strain ATCC 74030 / MF5533) TaxID=1104152 RepID=H0ERD7_GLAL7|nr:hypothetical protein M7I_5256 [Glarea lozoyensis 74030]